MIWTARTTQHGPDGPRWFQRRQVSSNHGGHEPVLAGQMWLVLAGMNRTGSVQRFVISRTGVC